MPGKSLPSLTESEIALVGLMIDQGVSELHVTPGAAGSILLAPSDYTVTVERDRTGLHILLGDLGVSAKNDQASFDDHSQSWS